MNNHYKKSLVWFRRDLRLYDQAALFHALELSESICCCFIFDANILHKLTNKEDRRVEFIWESIRCLKEELNALGSDILVRFGEPQKLIPQLMHDLNCEALFINKDYEDYALTRDKEVALALAKVNKKVHKYKDQVLFEEKEILTATGNPYTVFSPYRNNVLKKIEFEGIQQFNCEKNKNRFAQTNTENLISLEQLGFKQTNIQSLKIHFGTKGGILLIDDFKERLHQYKEKRDFPAIKGVSYLSVHNRFGTISVRHLAKLALEKMSQGSAAWLNELIWRDFYFQILANFPHINHAKSFKTQFEAVRFENNEGFFNAWKNAETGFPIIDAAMAQLNQTGFMHNRLRMVVASFLVKDLLIDWRWGESYFAEKLIDYDFSANNGGWQWAASTGCDAQPWFRIFNPILQSEKFDAEGKFIKKYIPVLSELPKKEIHAPWVAYEKNPLTFQLRLGKDYPWPIVNHKEQREKALKMYDLKNVG